MCARRWIGRASPGRAGARGSLISAPSSQNRVTAMAVGSGTAELGGGVTVAPRGGRKTRVCSPTHPGSYWLGDVYRSTIRLHAFRRMRRQDDPSRSFHRVEEHIIFSRLRFCVCVCARRSVEGARDPAGEYAAHGAQRRRPIQCTTPVGNTSRIRRPWRIPLEALLRPRAFSLPSSRARAGAVVKVQREHGEGRRRCTRVGSCCARPRSRDKFAPGSSHGKRNRLARIRIRTTARRIVLCIMIMMLQMCAMDSGQAGSPASCETGHAGSLARRRQQRYQTRSRVKKARGKTKTRGK